MLQLPLLGLPVSPEPLQVLAIITPAYAAAATARSSADKARGRSNLGGGSGCQRGDEILPPLALAGLTSPQ